MSNEEAPAVIEPGIDDLSLLLIVLSEVRGLIGEREAEVREALKKRMKRSQREPIPNPLDPSGALLGAVTMTNPKKTASVVDRAAFTAWVTEKYADKVTPSLKVIGSDSEVVTALAKYARHLLADDSTVDQKFENGIIAASIKAGMPVGPNQEADVPGIKVNTPTPQLRCVPEDNARARVFELVRAEQMSVSSLAVPQLAGGVA
jgi:hypothetical protein